MGQTDSKTKLYLHHKIGLGGCTGGFTCTTHILKYTAGAPMAEAKLVDGEAAVVSGGHLACTACAGKEAGPTDACLVY